MWDYLISAQECGGCGVWIYCGLPQHMCDGSGGWEMVRWSFVFPILFYDTCVICCFYLHLYYQYDTLLSFILYCQCATMLGYTLCYSTVLPMLYSTELLYLVLCDTLLSCTLCYHCLSAVLPLLYKSELLYLVLLICYSTELYAVLPCVLLY